MYVPLTEGPLIVGVDVGCPDCHQADLREAGGALGVGAGDVASDGAEVFRAGRGGLDRRLGEGECREKREKEGPAHARKCSAFTAW